MRFCYLFLALFFCLEGFAAERELLLVINFPQRYDYVPDFDDSLLVERLADWRDRRLILVGSGDRVLTDDIELLSSSTSLQLQRSESLRLARRRSIWVREKLESYGFDSSHLQLGILTEVDDSVIWGGFVKIYALGVGS